MLQQGHVPLPSASSNNTNNIMEVGVTRLLPPIINSIGNRGNAISPRKGCVSPHRFRIRHPRSISSAMNLVMSCNTTSADRLPSIRPYRPGWWWPFGVRRNVGALTVSSVPGTLRWSEGNVYSPSAPGKPHSLGGVSHMDTDQREDRATSPRAGAYSLPLIGAYRSSVSGELETGKHIDNQYVWTVNPSGGLGSRDGGRTSESDQYEHSLRSPKCTVELNENQVDETSGVDLNDRNTFVIQDGLSDQMSYSPMSAADCYGNGVTRTTNPMVLHLPFNSLWASPHSYVPECCQQQSAIAENQASDTYDEVENEAGALLSTVLTSHEFPQVPNGDMRATIVETECELGNGSVGDTTWSRVGVRDASSLFPRDGISREPGVEMPAHYFSPFTASKRPGGAKREGGEVSMYTAVYPNYGVDGDGAGYAAPKDYLIEAMSHAEHFRPFEDFSSPQVLVGLQESELGTPYPHAPYGIHNDHAGGGTGGDGRRFRNKSYGGNMFMDAEKLAGTEEATESEAETTFMSDYCNWSQDGIAEPECRPPATPRADTVSLYHPFPVQRGMSHSEPIAATALCGDPLHVHSPSTSHTLAFIAFPCAHGATSSSGNVTQSLEAECHDFSPPQSDGLTHTRSFRWNGVCGKSTPDNTLARGKPCKPKHDEWTSCSVSSGLDKVCEDTYVRRWDLEQHHAQNAEPIQHLLSLRVCTSSMKDGSDDSTPTCKSDTTGSDRNSWYAHACDGIRWVTSPPPTPTQPFLKKQGDQNHFANTSSMKW